MNDTPIYRGPPVFGDIHPWVTEGLLYYGFITPEQKDEADRRYSESWDKAWADTRWWAQVAKLAWYLEVPWWRRWWDLGIESQAWARNWIVERRGW